MEGERAADRCHCGAMVAWSREHGGSLFILGSAQLSTGHSLITVPPNTVRRSPTCCTAQPLGHRMNAGYAALWQLHSIHLPHSNCAILAPHDDTRPTITGCHTCDKGKLHPNLLDRGRMGQYTAHGHAAVHNAWGSTQHMGQYTAYGDRFLTMVLIHTMLSLMAVHLQCQATSEHFPSRHLQHCTQEQLTSQTTSPSLLNST